MKTIRLFTILTLMLIISAFSNGQPANGGQVSPDSKGIKVAASTEAIAISKAWASEYYKLNPSIQISVNEIGDSNNSGVSDFSIVLNEGTTANKDWRILIGRNAIIPIINKNNPLLAELNTKGVTAPAIEQLLSGSNEQNWGQILENEQNIPAKIYIYNIADKPANALNNTISCSELISKVQEDIFAIGFCSLTDIIIPGSETLPENLTIMPVDKNSNGRLDKFENIYGNVKDFTHGVWIGKYPKSLTESIYAVAAMRPENTKVTDFLSWIIADGQAVLNQNGYITLTSYQEKAGMESLTDIPAVVNLTPEKSETSFSWIILLAGIVIISVGALVIYSIIRMLSKTKKYDETTVRISKSLNVSSINSPEGIYYGKSHAWSFMEKDGTVKVGIDDFLQHITGPVTRVKMKESGDSIRKGEKMITINHDGKQLEIYAPVSGIIKEQNQSLNTNSALVNNSPYNDGWIYTIIPKNWSREIEFLLLGQEYREWLNDEFSRLKDFLARSVKNNEAAYQHVILQDGGELADNILADLEPKVWEDFQTRFLDLSK